MHHRGGVARHHSFGASPDRKSIFAVLCGGLICLLFVVRFSTDSSSPATASLSNAISTYSTSTNVFSFNAPVSVDRDGASIFASPFASDSRRGEDFRVVDPKWEPTFGEHDTEQVVVARMGEKIKMSKPHVACPTDMGRTGAGSLMSPSRTVNRSVCRRAALSTEQAATIMNIGPCDEEEATARRAAEVNDPSSSIRVVTPRHRLLCITYTVIKSHPKAAVMYKTWGTQCDQHLIFTNGHSIEGIPQEAVVHSVPELGEETYLNLWQKLKSIHKKMIAFRFPPASTGGSFNGSTNWRASTFAESDVSRIRVQPFDYLFVGGDDVMLYAPNIRRYVMEHLHPRLMEKEGGGMLVGYRFDPPHSTPFVSGGGYMMNEFAFHQLADLTEHSCELTVLTFAEDLITAVCMGHTGVEAVDARDEWGDNRFLPIGYAGAIAQGRNNNLIPWYRDFHDRPQENGTDVMSQYVSLMHYINVLTVQKYYDTHLAPLCSR